MTECCIDLKMAIVEGRNADTCHDEANGIGGLKIHSSELLRRLTKFLATRYCFQESSAFCIFSAGWAYRSRSRNTQMCAVYVGAGVTAIFITGCVSACNRQQKGSRGSTRPRFPQPMRQKLIRTETKPKNAVLEPVPDNNSDSVHA